MPLFSICIPCYNHEKYIGLTLESVLAQDMTDFEIIVADNCSTDGSRAVVESFTDPRIRLIKNRYNIGFAPNLQRVTQHATGQFINLLSSDDVMNPGALRTYADLIAQHPDKASNLVLMSQAWDIDAGGHRLQYVTRAPEDFAPWRVPAMTPEQIEAQPQHEIHPGFEVFTRCMRQLNTAGVFCTVMVARALWEAVEGYNSTQLINPDMDFIVKVLRRDPTVIYVNRPLYSYRRHDMGQAAQQSRAGGLKLQLDQYSYLLKFDERWLSGTGVTPEQQRRLFINRECLGTALSAIAGGNRVQALRLLAFAWATYPGMTLRQMKSYLVLALLLLGPIGTLLVRWMAARRRGPA